jgi:hypothetical protein
MHVSESYARARLALFPFAISYRAGCVAMFALLVCASCSSTRKKICFSQRSGEAGREVNTDCDRDGETLHVFLSAECRVVSDTWVTVTHLAPGTGPSKILCSTGGKPTCKVDVPIPAESPNPDRRPTKPVQVDLNVPDLPQYPGEILVEVGGKCDSKEIARGGTTCVLRRR